MNIKDARPWQKCQIEAKILGVVGGGLVVQLPGGHRVMIKQEHLDAVSLLEEEPQPAVKKKAKKTDD
jgi:hypothetical protein